MILEAARDVSWLDMALYNWPWMVLALIVLAVFIVTSLLWRRDLPFKSMELPDFIYDEEDDRYYYVGSDGESAWVTAEQPELPDYHYYDEKAGRFFNEADDGELYYIEPYMIPRVQRFAGSRVASVSLGTFLIGAIITFFLNSWILEGKADPRGLSQTLSVLYFDGDELLDKDLFYFPGDRYQNREVKVFDLPFGQAVADGSENAEDVVPDIYGLHVTFNDTDRALRIHLYQYEQYSGMCGGNADGQLLSVLLPDVVIYNIPYLPQQEYRGQGPPGSVTTYSMGCTTIRYLIIEDELYDTEIYPYSSEDAARINAEKRASY